MVISLHKVRNGANVLKRDVEQMLNIFVQHFSRVTTGDFGKKSKMLNVEHAKAVDRKSVQLFNISRKVAKSRVTTGEKC